MAAGKDLSIMLIDIDVTILTNAKSVVAFVEKILSAKTLLETFLVHA